MSLWLRARLVGRSPGGEVGGVAVVVVIWTHLLHQLVVGAVEGDEDANDFEGLGAQPGDVALGLLLRAALRGVVGTQRRPGALLHLFILHPAVEKLGVLGLQGRLLLVVMELLVLLVDLELHSFGRRNESYGHVALTGRIVAEVDAERPVAVINDFTSDEKVELHGLNIGMEVAPTEHLLEFAGLDDGPPFRSGSRVARI